MTEYGHFAPLAEDSQSCGGAKAPENVGVLKPCDGFVMAGRMIR